MNKYIIYTDYCAPAPVEERWQAAFLPLDEGESNFISGWGRTEHEAVLDLLNKVEELWDD